MRKIGLKRKMAAMMAVCNPGDRVIVFSPFYENYGTDAILSGAIPIYVPLKPPSYEFDPSELEAAFAQGVKAIIVCNPSNPCGKVFTRAELQYIHYFCGESGVDQEADEAFARAREKLYKLTSRLVRAYAELKPRMSEAGYSAEQQEKRDARVSF